MHVDYVYFNQSTLIIFPLVHSDISCPTPCENINDRNVITIIYAGSLSIDHYKILVSMHYEILS